MSDLDLLKFLDSGRAVIEPTDILGFAQNIAASNPWRTASEAILAPRFDTRTWSPAEAFGTALAQSFLGSALSGYAKNREASQLRALSAAMPQLSADPMSAAAPAGVDESAFDLLRLGAAAKMAQRREQLRDKVAELKLANMMAGERAALEEQGKISGKNAAYEALGVEDPDSPVVKAKKDAQAEEDRARGLLSKLPITTTIESMATALPALASLAEDDSKTSDFTFINTLVKAVGGGVVNEGEQARIVGAQSLPAGFIRQLEAGLNAKSELGVNTKRRFVDEFRRSGASLAATYKDRAKQEIEIAQSRGADPIKSNPLTEEFIGKTFGNSAQDIQETPRANVRLELERIKREISMPGASFEDKQRLRKEAEDLVASMVRRSPSGAPLG